MNRNISTLSIAKGNYKKLKEHKKENKGFLFEEMKGNVKENNTT
jgi:predicted CopG family antitoxin